ncbi:MAG: secondary thiamine-phosphate synthase enzyme YjbQ [Desulfovibrionaceae bacterium]
MKELQVRTSNRREMADITSLVQEAVSQAGWLTGAVLVYCPHTTGAITVNEGADPDVARDVTVNLSRLVPSSGDYRHAEGNSDAHIKASLVGPDQFVPVAEGRLRLGTWQRVFFCEFDGPRSRKIWVNWFPGE